MVVVFMDKCQNILSHCLVSALFACTLLLGSTLYAQLESTTPNPGATGTCTTGQTLSCTGSNPCKTYRHICIGGFWSPCTGFAKTNDTPCNDGNLCTTGDTCQNGSCTAGSPYCGAGDGNPCTQDCVITTNIFGFPAASCPTPPPADPNMIGQPCTLDGCGTCSKKGDGSCLLSNSFCADTNICTTDTCNFPKGCNSINNSATQSCYTGLAGTQNVGVCIGGTQTCSGGSLGACIGQVLPSTEICGNSSDENCDGSLINGCCGDATVQTPNNAGVNEQCDDGNASNTDTCTTSCLNARCGDTYIQTGEQCDDGNTSNIDACTNACLNARCGDTYIQIGEQCDDSNTVSTDACTATCQNAICGDSIVRAGVEQCDDGAQNGQPNQCNSTCSAITVPVCGNGAIESGEQCDDGNTANTDACTTTCQNAICGDSIVRAGVEQCDDGNTSDTDACLSCQNAACGDGQVQAGVEQCDDNNADNNDGCSSSCFFEPKCPTLECLPKDPILDANNRAALDCTVSGGTNWTECTITNCVEDPDPRVSPKSLSVTCTIEGTSPPPIGLSCTGAGGGCSGGGVPITPLVCDPKGPPQSCPLLGTTSGTIVNAACSSGTQTCKTDGSGWNACQADTTQSCEDGNLCTTGEQCNSNGSCGGGSPVVCVDDNPCDGSNSCDLADGQCKLQGSIPSNNDVVNISGFNQLCFDLRLIPCLALEICGDGIDNDCNLSIDDSCPVCGNGTRESGEQCDDNNTNAGDGCSATCQNEICGNGIVDPREACDDANTSNTDACTSSCQNARCGDGNLQTGVEICDDGNSIDTDSCRNNCTLQSCGDGFRSATEACDDGNTVDTDACRDNCTLQRCGDSFKSDAEACDDGNLVDNDACRNDCTLPSCGDGLVSSGEFCDDGTANSNATYNACKTDCSGRVEATCGNNIREGTEQCDGSSSDPNKNCVNCQLVDKTKCGDGIVQKTNDFGVNELCDDGNQIDTDSCRNNCTSQICGDGFKSDAEACDGSSSDPNKNCVNCQLVDKTKCGDGIVQKTNDFGVNELCDDGNQIDTDSCRNNCTSQICGDGFKSDVETCDEGLKLNGMPGHCTTLCTAPNCDDGDQCNGMEIYEINLGCKRGIPLDTEDNNACTTDACNSQSGEVTHIAIFASPPDGCQVADQCDPVSGWLYKADPSIGQSCDTAIDTCPVKGTYTCTAIPTATFVIKQVTCVPNASETVDANGNGIPDKCDAPPPPAPVCGNGTVETGEFCDDGAVNGQPTKCNTFCTAITAPVCGNGFKEGREECDDGNLLNGDGCTWGCRREFYMYIPPTPVCGDGTLDWNEACDDNNINNGDGCSEYCQFEPRCGDGNPDPGETCDQGLANSDTQEGACKTDCSGLVQPPKIVMPAQPCSSKIFDCTKVAAELSPNDEVFDATTIFPDVFDKQILIFTGTSGGKPGLVYNAAKKMAEDGKFKFSYCDLEKSDPLRHLSPGKINGPDINDLAGASDNKYYYLLDFENLIQRDASQTCSIEPKIIFEDAQRSMTSERNCNIAKIHDLKTLRDANGKANVVGAIECAIEQPIQEKGIGLDFFSYDEAQQKFSHQFVSFVKTYPADSEIVQLKVNPALENTTQVPKISVALAIKIGEKINTILVDCGKIEEKWDCPHSQEIKEPLLAMMDVDLEKISETPTQEKEHLLLSQSGQVMSEAPPPPAETGAEGQQTRTVSKTIYEEKGTVIRQDAQADTNFNPLGAPAQAVNAWYGPNAWNIYVTEKASLKGYGIITKENGELTVIKLDDEVLTPDSVISDVHSNETIQYLNPHHPTRVMSDNYGGADMVVFYDMFDMTDPKNPVKVGTMPFGYPNLNETPEIKLESQSDGKKVIISLSPSDKMDDDLICETHLKDQNGQNMDHLIIKQDCTSVEINLEEALKSFEHVSVPTPNTGISVGLSAKGVSKSSDNVSISNVAWPLLGTSCAEDAEPARGCADFSVSKSGSAQIVEAPARVEGGDTVTDAIPQTGGWMVSGKGCSLNPADNNGRDYSIYVLFILLGLLLASFRIQIAKNWRGRRDSNPRSSA